MTPPLQTRGSRRAGGSIISTSISTSPRPGYVTPLTISNRMHSTPRLLSGRVRRRRSSSLASTLSSPSQKLPPYSLALGTSRRAAISCILKTEATWDLRRSVTATRSQTACGRLASSRSMPRGERCVRDTTTASSPAASA